MLKGSQVALPTPFRDGEVDEAALRALVISNIEGGTGGLLVLGTTGEAPTLTDEEHRRVIKLVVDTAAKRVPIVAGSGSNSTRKAIFYTEQAKAAGADAALVVTPYYNKPSQEGLYRHYKAINDAVDIPVIMYNHPGRCVIELSVDTVARLAKLRNIIGVKDSNPSIARVIQLRQALGDDFLLVSGDEPTGLASMAYGGNTQFNTIGSAVPRAMAGIHEAWDAGDPKRARQLYAKVMPLAQAMYVESNPVPLKYMLSLLGKCTAEVRLPLCELSDASKGVVQKALDTCGLLPRPAAALQPA
ncbi:MAG TPA: 4-hydroxy-tetrahydrodipicolinate synthase [Candidatus Limnocylindria bacterium]